MTSRENPRHIERQWQAFLRVCAPNGCSDDQAADLKKAFFGGALAYAQITDPRCELFRLLRMTPWEANAVVDAEIEDFLRSHKPEIRYDAR